MPSCYKAPDPLHAGHEPAGHGAELHGAATIATATVLTLQVLALAVDNQPKVRALTVIVDASCVRSARCIALPYSLCNASAGAAVARIGARICIRVKSEAVALLPVAVSRADNGQKPEGHRNNKKHGKSCSPHETHSYLKEWGQKPFEKLAQYQAHVVFDWGWRRFW